MRIGPYELLDVAGQGQLGPVYHACHHETNQQVAVKILTPECAVEMALWERRASARSAPHQHAIDYLECGLDGSRPYLVMEWVPGPNLGEWFQQYAPLPEGEAVQLLRGLGDALDHAHGQGMIHGDVKPENILLAADGRAKLSDLGLGKDLQYALRQARLRTLSSSPASASAEAQGEPPDEDYRCDVYGLGAVLYYAVTGVIPLLGVGARSLSRTRVRQEIRSPRQFMPLLSAQIERALGQALAPSPSQRPHCCAEIFAALPVAQPAANTEHEEGPAHVPVHERRKNPRFSAALGASCRALLDQKSRWHGEVQDVSLRGIRLLLDRRFEPGVLLNVEVFDEQAELIHAWLVQVRWVRELVAKKWSVGCVFNRELSADELRGLMEHEHATARIHAVA